MNNIQDITTYKDLFKYLREKTKSEIKVSTLAYYQGEIESNTDYKIISVRPFPILEDEQPYTINAFLFNTTASLNVGDVLLIVFTDRYFIDNIKSLEKIPQVTKNNILHSDSYGIGVLLTPIGGTSSGTVTEVSTGTGLKITGNPTINPKVEVDDNYKLPTSTEWMGKADIEDIPTTYLVDASVSGNQLVLVKSDGTVETYEPASGEPEHYLKSAVVDKDTLTLTDENNTNIDYNPVYYVQYNESNLTIMQKVLDLVMAHKPVGVKFFRSTSTLATVGSRVETHLISFVYRESATSIKMVYDTPGYYESGTTLYLKGNTRGIITLTVTNNTTTVTEVSWQIVSERFYNSTITIQKNGTTVSSFTLNQSSNKTINIPVPVITANPDAPSSGTLNKIAIDGTVFAMPSGGGGSTMYSHACVGRYTLSGATKQVYFNVICERSTQFTADTLEDYCDTHHMCIPGYDPNDEEKYYMVRSSGGIGCFEITATAAEFKYFNSISDTIITPILSPNPNNNGGGDNEEGEILNNEIEGGIEIESI